MSKEIHLGCGGEVRNRICLKCNKVWGSIGYVFTKDIQIVEESTKFDKEDYKKRIREGRDIYK